MKEFVEKINGLEQFHEALVRSGFFLPKIKCSLVNQDYLEGVAKGEIWCPRFEEVRLRPCPRPPTKKHLAQRLILVLEAKRKAFNLDLEKLPDKLWLLAVLATLSPDDPVFLKNYLPPSITKKKVPEKSIEIPLAILEGLSQMKSKLKRVRLATVTKGKELERLNRMKERKTLLEGTITSFEG